MKKILLAVCCAPCATVAVEQLSGEYALMLHFWGNNLDTEEEYQKRLSAVRILAQSLGVPIHVTDYSPTQPKDCAHCFEMRLSASAGHGFRYFATSLTASPHKCSLLVNNIGGKFEGYVASNFKKNNGFARSVQLSKELGLYRQNYCGCGRSKKRLP